VASAAPTRLLFLQDWRLNQPFHLLPSGKLTKADSIRVGMADDRSARMCGDTSRGYITAAP
jgi:hypothetical protein